MSLLGIIMAFDKVLHIRLFSKLKQHLPQMYSKLKSSKEDLHYFVNVGNLRIEAGKDWGLGPCLICCTQPA